MSGLGGSHGNSSGGNSSGGIPGKLVGQLASNLFSSGHSKPEQQSQNYHGGQSHQPQHSGGLGGSVMGGAANIFGGLHGQKPVSAVPQMIIETTIDWSSRTRIMAIRTRAKLAAIAGKLPRHHTNHRVRRQRHTLHLLRTNITPPHTTTRRASMERRHFLHPRASKQHHHTLPLLATQGVSRITTTAHRTTNSRAPSMAIFHHLPRDTPQVMDIARFRRPIIVCDPCSVQ